MDLNNKANKVARRLFADMHDVEKNTDSNAASIAKKATINSQVSNTSTGKFIRPAKPNSNGGTPEKQVKFDLDLNSEKKLTITNAERLMRTPEKVGTGSYNDKWHSPTMHPKGHQKLPGRNSDDILREFGSLYARRQDGSRSHSPRLNDDPQGVDDLLERMDRLLDKQEDPIDIEMMNLIDEFLECPEYSSGANPHQGFSGDRDTMKLLDEQFEGSEDSSSPTPVKVNRLESPLAKRGALRNSTDYDTAESSDIEAAE